MVNTQTFERAEYQQVKADLHRKILDRLDLEKLGRTPGDAAREEVLLLIRNTVNSEAVPLSFAERERLSREILDEIFGLGPLEPLLRDSTISDILVNRFDRVYVERAGKIETIFEIGSVGAKGPRLQIASTEPAVTATASARPAAADEPFFTHICGTRVMANITVSPGRSGPVEVLVQLEDGDEKPLAVDALSVTLSNPDKGIAPVTATAERVAADSWRVRLTAAASGKWSLSLGIDLAKDDRVDIAAPILIE